LVKGALGDKDTAPSTGGLFEITVLAVLLAEPPLPSLLVAVHATIWPEAKAPVSVLVRPIPEVAATVAPLTVHEKVVLRLSPSASAGAAVQTRAVLRVAPELGLRAALTVGARFETVRLAVAVALLNMIVSLRRKSSFSPVGSILTWNTTALSLRLASEMYL
jgi:hypothetical protein